MGAINQSLSGNLVDILNRRIFPAKIEVADGKIAAISESTQARESHILPGFIDAHVHVESSMLTPPEFARAAVVHGTVATVSDPHEIANVLGTEGVHYMLDGGERVPFKFFFGAPSCVPATKFETSGDEITAEQVAALLDDPRVLYLSEMMNFPGVLAGDEQVAAKIRAAHQRGKPVDGHAPGLRGDDAKKYIEAGITTDHECFTREEALDKLACGMKISIREGSAARNFDALYTLIDEYPEHCMLCSDDKHPDELLQGHINQLVQRAIHGGMDTMNVLRAACINPVLHYGLDVGLLRVGDDADFIEVDNLDNLNVLSTTIRGQRVAENGTCHLEPVRLNAINRFAAQPRTTAEFSCKPDSRPESLHVIEAIDGQLVTRRRDLSPRIINKEIVSDPDRDILKMAVVNRYIDAPPAIAFVTNFGLMRGAMASSVAHDSHNVIAVGAHDEDLCAAVNLVIEAGGGLAVTDGSRHEVLPLPVAGLMSTDTCQAVGAAYSKLDQMTKQLGSKLRAPFMTLSFMALLVIPEIKLSDRGLFDGNRFEFMPLWK